MSIHCLLPNVCTAGRPQFCAQTELYQSEYIVCDGTFEKYPDSSFQLYTIHGFRDGEAMALAWALLPNKTKASYVELFTATRDAFVTEFGDVACDHPFARPN